jgi:hypothetical protein
MVLLAMLVRVCLHATLLSPLVFGQLDQPYRRADDSLPLEHVVQELSASLNALQAKATSQESRIQHLEGNTDEFFNL